MLSRYFAIFAYSLLCKKFRDIFLKKIQIGMLIKPFIVQNSTQMVLCICVIVACDLTTKLYIRKKMG